MKKATRFLAIILAVTCVSTTVLPQAVSAASWKKDSTGWWYQTDNGSYPKNQWKKISSKWYWFDTNGYMVTGWKKINGAWYYFDSNGVMLEKGWHKIGSSYYYMYDTGAMAQNTWIGNEYVDANGVWIQGKTKYVQGWKKSGNRWWYCHKDGSYTKNGWEKINGKYYYFDAGGYMITGWKKVNGTWYYMKSDGVMMSNGWLKINSNWYYFNADGAMLGKGWHKIKEKWYYMYESGVMAANTWIGNSYVDKNGVWNPNTDAVTKYYADVIAEYKEAIKHKGYPGFDELVKGNYVGHNILSSMRFAKNYGGVSNENFYIYYALDDINADGIEEMFIGGRYSGDSTTDIYEVFTSDGLYPQAVYDVGTLRNYRYGVMLLNDNTLLEDRHSGAWSNSITRYKLKKNSSSLQFIEEYGMQDSKCYYLDKNGNKSSISYSSYTSTWDNLKNNAKKMSWKIIS